MHEYATRVGPYLIRVTKVGGGTFGLSYDGDWEVLIEENGTVVMDNVITTDTPKNHIEVADLALEFADDLDEV